MLQRLAAREAPMSPGGPAPLDIARNQLSQLYDQRYGGFGNAPKFPHPTHIDRLFRHWAATTSTAQTDPQAMEMALLTLTAKAEGGHNDQQSGGFCCFC